MSSAESNRARAERIAKKYNPKIYWDSGKLDSDYHFNKTVEACEEMALEVRRETIEQCAIASESYLPKAHKWTEDMQYASELIAEAIRALLPAEKETR